MDIYHQHRHYLSFGHLYFHGLSVSVRWNNDDHKPSVPQSNGDFDGDHCLSAVCIEFFLVNVDS